MILDEIMKKTAPGKKPCEVFDMIAAGRDRLETGALKSFLERTKGGQGSINEQEAEGEMWNMRCILLHIYISLLVCIHLVNRVKQGTDCTCPHYHVTNIPWFSASSVHSQLMYLQAASQQWDLERLVGHHCASFLG